MLMLRPPFDFDIIEITDAFIFTTMGEVPRKEFDQWLVDSDSLDWELNTCDHAGEHVQKTGRHTIDEYYMQPHSVIHTDIVEFYTRLIRRVPIVNLTHAATKLKNLL